MPQPQSSRSPYASDYNRDPTSTGDSDCNSTKDLHKDTEKQNTSNDKKLIVCDSQSNREILCSELHELEQSETESQHVLQDGLPIASTSGDAFKSHSPLPSQDEVQSHTDAKLYSWCVSLDYLSEESLIIHEDSNNTNVTVTGLSEARMTDHQSGNEALDLQHPVQSLDVVPLEPQHVGLLSEVTLKEQKLASSPKEGVSSTMCINQTPGNPETDHPIRPSLIVRHQSQPYDPSLKVQKENQPGDSSLEMQHGEKLAANPSLESQHEERLAVDPALEMQREESQAQYEIRQAGDVSVGVRLIVSEVTGCVGSISQSSEESKTNHPTQSGETLSSTSVSQDVSQNTLPALSGTLQPLPQLLRVALSGTETPEEHEDKGGHKQKEAEENLSHLPLTLADAAPPEAHEEKTTEREHGAEAQLPLPLLEYLATGQSVFADSVDTTIAATGTDTTTTLTSVPSTSDTTAVTGSSRLHLERPPSPQPGPSQYRFQQPVSPGPSQYRFQQPVPPGPSQYRLVLPIEPLSRWALYPRPIAPKPSQPIALKPSPVKYRWVMVPGPSQLRYQQPMEPGPSQSGYRQPMELDPNQSQHQTSSGDTPHALPSSSGTRNSDNDYGYLSESSGERQNTIAYPTEWQSVLVREPELATIITYIDKSTSTVEVPQTSDTTEQGQVLLQEGDVGHTGTTDNINVTATPMQQSDQEFQNFPACAPDNSHSADVKQLETTETSTSQEPSHLGATDNIDITANLIQQSDQQFQNSPASKSDNSHSADVKQHETTETSTSQDYGHPGATDNIDTTATSIQQSQQLQNQPASTSDNSRSVDLKQHETAEASASQGEQPLESTKETLHPLENKKPTKKFILHKWEKQQTVQTSSSSDMHTEVRGQDLQSHHQETLTMEERDAMEEFVSLQCDLEMYYLGMKSTERENEQSLEAGPSRERQLVPDSQGNRGVEADMDMPDVPRTQCDESTTSTDTS